MEWRITPNSYPPRPSWVLTPARHVSLREALCHEVSEASGCVQLPPVGAVQRGFWPLPTPNSDRVPPGLAPSPSFTFLQLPGDRQHLRPQSKSLFLGEERGSVLSVSCVPHICWQHVTQAVCPVSAVPGFPSLVRLLAEQ